jgi:D-serine deaminase-like pyridoxal phosphate-dependent protein
MQRQVGAVGVTVAKPSEAEVFVNNGFSDVRIAYPCVARHHLEHIASLMDRANISFCVDTLEGASQASAFFEARGLTARVLIEVDSGYGRCGVLWDDADSISFAADLLALPGLQVVGVLTHAGEAYAGPSGADESVEEYVRRIAIRERDRTIGFARALYEAGLKLPDRNKFEISIGSTPTMSAFTNSESAGFTVTEIRPGNYLFNDAIQVALGVARPGDCALTVMATVVSRHRDRRSHERVFVDAGRKILTSDTGFGTDGYGTVLHSASTMSALPHARLSSLSEEHGWMEVAGGSTLAVGDRVRIIPNHACVAVNTQSRMYLVSGEKVIREIKVDARGMST